jgi:hypothetical protein
LEPIVKAPALLSKVIDEANQVLLAAVTPLPVAPTVALDTSGESWDAPVKTKALPPAAEPWNGAKPPAQLLPVEKSASEPPPFQVTWAEAGDATNAALIKTAAPIQDKLATVNWLFFGDFRGFIGGLRLENVIGFNV